MADNTQVNVGSGDTVRDIDRSLNPTPISAKTQVVQLDAGGQYGEALVSAQSPMPVYDPSNQIRNLLQLQLLQFSRGGVNGFVPIETPSFLVG
jgi:hypothetical protein